MGEVEDRLPHWARLLLEWRSRKKRRGGESLRLRAKRKLKLGGRVIAEGEEFEVDEISAEHILGRGLAEPAIEIIEELPTVEPPQPTELKVVTSDVAEEAGLRRMRARVLRVERTTGLRGSEQVHLVLRPLDREWSDLHEWYHLSKSRGSAFVELCDQLVKLGAVSKGGSLTEIQGKAFEWEEREGVGRSQRPKWWPLRLVE